MIEIIVKEFLSSKLDVPVLLEVPKNPAASFVIIEKTGGNESNYIPSSLITIQSFGKSKYEAAALNKKVKRWMIDGVNGLVSVDEVVSVAINSDYDYTDTTEKRYRYQGVYDITHY